MSDKAYSVGNAKRQIFLLTDILFRVTYISSKSRYVGIKNPANKSVLLLFPPVPIHYQLVSGLLLPTAVRTLVNC